MILSDIAAMLIHLVEKTKRSFEVIIGFLSLFSFVKTNDLLACLRLAVILLALGILGVAEAVLGRVADQHPDLDCIPFGQTLDFVLTASHGEMDLRVQSN